MAAIIPRTPASRPVLDAIRAAGFDPARVGEVVAVVRDTKIEYAGEDYDLYFECSQPGDSRIVPLPPRIDFDYLVGDRFVMRSVTAPRHAGEHFRDGPPNNSPLTQH